MYSKDEKHTYNTGGYQMGTNQVIGGGGFHHIAIKVRDFDASVKFYSEGFGFKERLRWGEGEGRAVLLDTGDGNYLEIFAGGSKKLKPKGSIIHMAFRTNDVAKAIEAARAAGAKITLEPEDLVVSNNPPTSIRIAFCKGPDNEIIEFFQSTGENQL
jgi:glyoxylase I family protein